MYTKEQFAIAIKRRGFPARKAQIEAYLDSHPKDFYDEDDLMDYYYFTPSEHMRKGKRLGKCADGQDWNSPSNERNGGSDPLRQINKIYDAIDRDNAKRAACR